MSEPRPDQCDEFDASSSEEPSGRLIGKDSPLDEVLQPWLELQPGDDGQHLELQVTGHFVRCAGKPFVLPCRWQAAVEEVADAQDLFPAEFGDVSWAFVSIPPSQFPGQSIVGRVVHAKTIDAQVTGLPAPALDGR